MNTVRTWCAIVLMFGSTAFAQEQRFKIPTPAEQTRAEELIHKVFGDKLLKKSLEDRMELMNKFIEIAADSKDDTSAKYALLMRAQKIALDTGNIPMTITITDILYKEFDVDKYAEHLRALKSLTSFKTLDHHKYADAVISQMNSALCDGEYDAFSGFLELLRFSDSKSRTAKSKAIVAAMVEVQLELANTIGTLNEVRINNQVSEKASYIAGRFQCIYAGNWTKGLPLLNKGSDKEYANAAAKDIDDSEEPTEQLTVGDLWWKIYEREKDSIAKTRLLSRSIFWYKKSVVNLTGFSKTRVEARITKSDLLFNQQEKSVKKVEEKPKPVKVVKLWAFDGQSSKIVIIRNKGTGLVLDAEPTNGASLILTEERKGKASQAWKLEKSESGDADLNIRHVATKRLINLPGGSYTAGTKLIAYTGDGRGVNVRWTINEKDGAIELVSIHSKMLLTSSISGKMALVVQDSAKQDDSQLWMLSEYHK